MIYIGIFLLAQSSSACLSTYVMVRLLSPPSQKLVFYIKFVSIVKMQYTS